MAAMDPLPSGAISATDPDWSREVVDRLAWNPGRQLLRALRDYQRLAGVTGALAEARRWEAAARHRFWSSVAGADIPLATKIGGGLLLPHPNGVVIHPDALIGPNCLLFQQVTIGAGGPRPGVPRVGGHVDVGAGAKILGGVSIGAHSKIGANAVVLADVPEYATAVGVPAVVHAAAESKRAGGAWPP
jgi:serine O-acetyltransferase